MSRSRCTASLLLSRADTNILTNTPNRLKFPVFRVTSSMSGREGVGLGKGACQDWEGYGRRHLGPTLTLGTEVSPPPLAVELLFELHGDRVVPQLGHG